MIDANAITLIQTNFLAYIGQAFSQVAQYGLNLLYLFAVIEVVVLGLLWATQQSAEWGRVLFKAVKIGMIFYLVTNFASFASTMIASFAGIGATLASTPHLSEFIFNPARLWEYGYDSSLLLMQAGAAANTSVGLAIVQVSLGFGILLCFALLGIQIVLQLVSFYLTVALGLIFLPLGVFVPTTNMLEQSIVSVLVAGVRVVVLIFIVGVAITTWHVFHLGRTPISLSINQALGLFDTALLFAYLAMRMPGLVASLVGRIQFQRLTDKSVSVVNVPAPASAAGATPAFLSNMQAAAAINPNVVAQSHFSGMSAASAGSMVSATTVTPTQQSANVQVKVDLPRQRGHRADLGIAQQVEKSISDDMLKKLQKTFKDALDKHHGAG